VTPATELDRLFGQVLQNIPKPVDPAAVWTAAAAADCIRNNKLKIDPIDADETNYGVCAQGESDDN